MKRNWVDNYTNIFREKQNLKYFYYYIDLKKNKIISYYFTKDKKMCVF